jgi:hypothetical protein
MIKTILLIVPMILMTRCLSAAPQQQTPSSPNPMVITAPESEQAVLPALRDDIQDGMGRIERFFGHRFAKTFRTQVFPDRSSFDTCLEKQMAIPQPQRWMVAAGVSGRLVLLSPRVWATDADEHDPHDRQHVRDLITHELVHVYHAQRNPGHDFDGMDDLGWFVEGLADYVSGQLEHSHREDARMAIQEGKAPDKMADAWSGRYRYGVSGSMVQYIDRHFGRKMLWKMLNVTKPKQALRLLHVTEPEFLEAWKRFVLSDLPEER